MSERQTRPMVVQTAMGFFIEMAEQIRNLMTAPAERVSTEPPKRHPELSPVRKPNIPTLEEFREMQRVAREATEGLEWVDSDNAWPNFDTEAEAVAFAEQNLLNQYEKHAIVTISRNNELELARIRLEDQRLASLKV